MPEASPIVRAGEGIERESVGPLQVSSGDG